MYWLREVGREHEVKCTQVRIRERHEWELEPSGDKSSIVGLQDTECLSQRGADSARENQCIEKQYFIF